MKRLKQMLLNAERGINASHRRIVVVGSSIESCLNQAAKHWGADLHKLDYKILEQGSQSLLNPKPYRIEATLLSDEQLNIDIDLDLEELSAKLGVGRRLLDKELEQQTKPVNKDGRVAIRNWREGVTLIVAAPQGEGQPASLEEALRQIRQHGALDFDIRLVEKSVKEADGSPTVIAKFTPNPDHESTCHVEITPDAMRAFVRIRPPRPQGLHLTVSDVIAALRSYGVVHGFKARELEEHLLEDHYMHNILAAEGKAPKHGANAYIDYKVDISKNRWKFDEESEKRADFRELHLIENVTVGQVLAERAPPGIGAPGRNLYDNYIPARDGKDIKMRAGKGAMLSEDGSRIIAEINGQVIIKDGRVSVDPVYMVINDVGPKTGNIDFLGSVVVDGSVLDNYEVKAGGSITVGGSIQKAVIQADSDIVARGGVHGAQINSQEGSVYAKFFQNATVKAKERVEAAEGILHSQIEAEDEIICNGKRAQIVGGKLRAQRRIRAKTIGSQAYTITEINVGTNPTMLAEYEEKQNSLNEINKHLSDTHKVIATLQSRKKADSVSFGEQQEKLLEESLLAEQELEKSKNQHEESLSHLEEAIQANATEGKVEAEKQLMPGVSITIRDAHLNITDTHHQAALLYKNGHIKIQKLEREERHHPIARSWRQPRIRR